MKTAPAIQKDLVQITWALTLYRLASNIIGIFIPLIIIKSGGRLSTISLFYLVYALVKLCINYLCMRIIQRRGAHFGITIGFVFSAIQTISVLIYAHSHMAAVLVFGAVALAFTNGFIWNAKHYFISRYMDKATKSSNIAGIEIYGQLSDIVGPLIGGIVGAVFGPVWLLAVALLCLASTAWPLYKVRALPPPSQAAEPEIIRYSLSGAPRGDLIANFSFNIEAMIGLLVWPIYLAVAVHSYRSIGGVAAVAAVASIIATHIAGRRGDRGEDKAILVQGVVASSLIDIGRLAAISLPFITVIGTLYKASLAYFINAWTSTYYQHAQDKGAQYIISMEIACDLAYATFWTLFFVLSLTVTSSRWLFNIVFLIAAVAAYGCLLITRQNHDNQ